MPEDEACGPDAGSATDPDYVRSPDGGERFGGIERIVAFAGKTCAITSSTEIWCWGENYFNQIRVDADGGPAWLPTRVEVADAAVPRSGVNVAPGYSHTCAHVTYDGGADRTFCWGVNQDGQLGNGNVADELPGTDRFVRIASTEAPLSGVRSIVSGCDHSCALLADGSVYCWGLNDSGQVGSPGDAGTERYAHPVAGLGRVRLLAAGCEHNCALQEDGELLCWGNNEHGQLGDGTTVSRATPRPVAWR